MNDNQYMIIEMSKRFLGEYEISSQSYDLNP